MLPISVIRARGRMNTGWALLIIFWVWFCTAPHEEVKPKELKGDDHEW